MPMFQSKVLFSVHMDTISCHSCHLLLMNTLLIMKIKIVQ